MFSLLDDYRETGYDFDQFMKTAREFDSHTVIQEINLCEIQILNFHKKVKETLYCQIIDPDTQVSDDGMYYKNRIFRIDTKNIKQKHLEVVNEFITGSRTLFRYSGISGSGFYFIGDPIYKTLAARQTGIGGKFLHEAGYIRNLALAACMADSADSVHAIIRKDGGLQKMFAFHKSRFKHYPYRSIAALAANYRDITTYLHWEISHTKIAVYLEFQNNMDFVPGLYICASDTGHYAASVTTTLRHPQSSHNEYFMMNQYLLNDFLEEDKPWFYKAILATLKENQRALQKTLSATVDCYQLCKKSSIASLVGIKKKTEILAGTAKIQGINEFIRYVCDINNKGLSDSQIEKYRQWLLDIITEVAYEGHSCSSMSILRQCKDRLLSA